MSPRIYAEAASAVLRTSSVTSPSVTFPCTMPRIPSVLPPAWSKTAQGHEAWMETVCARYGSLWPKACTFRHTGNHFAAASGTRHPVRSRRRAVCDQADRPQLFNVCTAATSLRKRNSQRPMARRDQQDPACELPWSRRFRAIPGTSRAQNRAHRWRGTRSFPRSGTLPATPCCACPGEGDDPVCIPSPSEDRGAVSE
jgi:hypothetical protein